MPRARTRVRLTKADWKAIYDGVAFAADERGEVRLYESDMPRMRTVLRKIGVDGMAARDRGVAPVPRRAGR